MFLIHWINQSSTHLSCPRFINSHPDLHRALLVITGAFIARPVTQRAMSFHQRWYLCLFHWIIQSSLHISYPLFIKSHPDLHRTLFVITGALIASTATQRATSCHHRWYLCLINWMIHPLIHLSFPWFVNSCPDLHKTQRQSRKLLQYLVWIHLIRQIPCHCCPPRMEVEIFMYA